MNTNLEEYVDPSLYDAEYGSYTGDFDFFLNLIPAGSVLDLGCGTGRLTIPFAQKGCVVTGLDASEAMLSLAQKKGKNLPIEWIQGDMSELYFPQKFDLITMGGNAFQALLSETDQKRMLTCVKHHLKPSGLFAFNTRNPQEVDFKTVSDYIFWHSFCDPEGEKVQVYGKQQADVSASIVTYTTKRVWKDKETLSTIHLRFTPYKQLLKLISQAGLRVLEVHGDEQKSPFQKESPSIVMVCGLYD